MVFLTYANQGHKRLVDLTDVYNHGSRTAILMGAAPSIKTQPLHLLEQRGVVTMAMNNAAMHFKPTLWCSGDNPACYEPQILLDPTIVKFAPDTHANTEYRGNKYHYLSNMFFYMQKTEVPVEDFFTASNFVPWYNNTLFVSIHILYFLGFRRIILGGSDFTIQEKNVYAHATEMDELCLKWNNDLYRTLARDLVLFKPYFEKAGLTFMDCSVNSKLTSAYKHVTMEEAVELCKEGFPPMRVDPKTLPHCSKFAPADLIERIRNGKGTSVYQGFFHGIDEPKPKSVAVTPVADPDMKDII